MVVGHYSKDVRWKPEEDQVLRERYSNTTVEDLCVILNRSRRSVLGRLNRLRITKFHLWTANELGWMLEHYRTMSHDEMASFLGKTKRSVAKAAARYGMLKHRRMMDDHEQRRFKNLYGRGYSDLLISRKTGMSKSKVLRHRLRVGLPGNGHTDKSASAKVANRPDDYNDRLKAAHALKRNERCVPESALIEIAMLVIGDDDELLSVAWDGINDDWKRGVDSRSDLETAGREAIRRFRRDTESFMSIDSFVDEDGKRFEMSEDKRRGM